MEAGEEQGRNLCSSSFFPACLLPNSHPEKTHPENVISIRICFRSLNNSHVGIPNKFPLWIILIPSFIANWQEDTQQVWSTCTPLLLLLWNHLMMRRVVEIQRICNRKRQSWEFYLNRVMEWHSHSNFVCGSDNNSPDSTNNNYNYTSSVAACGN